MRVSQRRTQIYATEIFKHCERIAVPTQINSVTTQLSGCRQKIFHLIVKFHREFSLFPFLPQNLQFIYVTESWCGNLIPASQCPQGANKLFDLRRPLCHADNTGPISVVTHVLLHETPKRFQFCHFMKKVTSTLRQRKGRAPLPSIT